MYAERAFGRAFRVEINSDISLGFSFRERFAQAFRHFVRIEVGTLSGEVLPIHQVPKLDIAIWYIMSVPQHEEVRADHALRLSPACHVKIADGRTRYAFDEHVEANHQKSTEKEYAAKRTAGHGPSNDCRLQLERDLCCNVLNASQIDPTL